MPDKTPLLLLHGALGSKSQFGKIEKILQKDFAVYTMNFSGHGGSQIPTEPFSIELFAGDILNYIIENKIENCNIFGYSMGGYAALYLAKNHPGKTGRIFTLATKFEWNQEISAREIKMLDAGKIMEKIPKYAEELRLRHSPADWQEVLLKTSEMMINLGKNNPLKKDDYSVIENEVQIAVGDRDKMVSIEESLNVYRKLKNGKMLVMPDTPHPLEQVDAARLIYEIKYFLL